MSICVAGVTSQTWRIGVPCRGTSTTVPSWKLVSTVRSSMPAAFSAATTWPDASG